MASPFTPWLSTFSRSWLRPGGWLPASLLGAFLTTSAPADYLLVANKGDRSLSLVDAATHEEVAAVPVDGVTGHEVAASPDGKFAYVPIFGSGGVGTPGTDGQLIRIIDLAERKITGTIDFEKGVRPHCAITNAATNRLFVTVENNQAVALIDLPEGKILGEVTTGAPESHMLTVSKDGTRGYTANVGPGTVSVLDLKKRELIKVLPVCRRVQRISLSVDDKQVFTSDQFDPELVVIDAATLEISARIPLPGCGYGTAPTPDGKFLLVALSLDNKIAVVDLAERKVVRTLDVPKAPQAVLVRPDGAFAYASCDASGQIAVLDLKEWKVAKLVKVGAVADGLAWAATP